MLFFSSHLVITNVRLSYKLKLVASVCMYVMYVRAYSMSVNIKNSRTAALFSLVFGVFMRPGLDEILFK